MRATQSADAHAFAIRCLPAIAVLVILVALGVPAAAEPPGGILEEVLAMLEAGMSEPIIVQWLDGSDQRPERPSAADLIGLKQAGASDELLAKLLELASVEADGPRPVEEPEPASTVEPNPPAASPPAPAPTDPGGGPTEVYFELSYRPDFDEDEEEWGLYVYLDGEPLSFVPAGSLLSSKPLRFRQLLPPGDHTLRVAQERHVKRGRDRWFHAARISELELPLVLQAGERADVELKFNQSQFAFGSSEGPLSFRLVQGKEVEVVERQGGDPESWPLVCEEIEANAAPGQELKKSLRRQLEDCTRWSEVWGDLEVPPRDEVREALALFRYRPIPKDQALD